ncbi:MAG: Regulatory protein BlaR1 [Firmicutes bacterium ADurb.Bin419]|nr:MAG: Regulatory protein BlaR1 [Firmicutes bacterium ADurb.Bin419]
MITTSVHWFNPLMHFIRKEINHACEMACDEAVIKDFNSSEKQAYGETLICLVAENKYPLGVLQATMCEEKRSLKERLVAIMNHNKKPRVIVIFSMVLLGTIIFGAAYLGAGVGKNNSPDINIGTEELRTKVYEIAKYKTPYLGDNSKVSAIVGQLPEPDSYFKQQYISMITDGTNKLNVYYEAKEGASHSNEWPVENPESPTYSNMQKNALILFCMIDNLNKVTFAFRDSKSDGKLDTSKYNTEFNFSRASVQEQFGNLSVLGGNLEKLQDALAGENIYVEPEFTNQEVTAARSVVEEYFRAVKAKDSKAILKTLTPVHNDAKVVLYGEETRTLLTIDYNPEDPMRQSYITNGRGSVNSVKKENVIVFKVSFNVEYPKGISGAFNEGEYANWSVILIREDKDSPWLIDDQGY